MFAFKLLPWEYAIRNLFRRPLRTALTFIALTTVVVLVFVVVGFIQGLDRTLNVSGDPSVAVVYSLGMGENLEYSSIPMKTGDLVAASVAGIRERFGQKHVSSELFLATQIGFSAEDEPAMGLVRGVSASALLVRRHVEIEQGTWPGSDEVLVGRLAATKLGRDQNELTVGKTIQLEGRSWRISGQFSARGTAFESEIWCRLDDLQQAMKRQDLSLVAVTIPREENFAELNLFCKSRTDLKLQAIRENDYYERLQSDYWTVRMLSWLVVLLVAAAGIFTGLNTMYGSVVGRTSELSMLQTIGFARRAIAVSLIQEAVLLAAAASLAATGTAIVLLNGTAIRFTMGAFMLHIDRMAVLIGCCVGLLLGLVGAIPPAIRAFRMSVVEGLKTV